MKSAGLFLALLLTTGAAYALSPNAIAFVPVPALDDLGVIALAAVVGVVGAIVIRRKNRK